VPGVFEIVARGFGVEFGSKRIIENDPVAGRIERPQPLLRGRDARLSEELRNLLVGECFARATYKCKNWTGKPAVHLKNVGFCETFGQLLRLTGGRAMAGVRVRALTGVINISPAFPRVAELHYSIGREFRDYGLGEIDLQRGTG